MSIISLTNSDQSESKLTPRYKNLCQTNYIRIANINHNLAISQSYHYIFLTIVSSLSDAPYSEGYLLWSLCRVLYC